MTTDFASKPCTPNKLNTIQLSLLHYLFIFIEKFLKICT